MRRFKYNDVSVVNPTEKTCYGCHETKSIQEFNKCKTGVYGLHNHCRDCSSATKKEWDKKNKTHCENYRKNEGLASVKKQREKFKIRYSTDAIFREKILKKNRDRRRSDECRSKARKQRSKWMAIPENRIAVNYRSLLRANIKYGYKSDHTEKLLGCTFESCKNHLESQFEKGMSWENYGAWHIDHIIPCSHFDLSDPEQQKICFHYLNLRPLWAKENIAKGGKIYPELYSSTLERIKLSLF